VLVTGVQTFALPISTTSGSLSTRVTIIEGQDATTGSNTFTGPQYMSEASNAIGFTSTASLYTDGGLRVTKDSFVSGTAYFNNVVVYGTSSIQYITSSQVNFGTNIITVNTDTPAVRFGGLAVFDSGSTQLTGSMLWDSQTNHWVYSNPSGSSYSGGMIMSGPRASSLGTEQGTTNNALMKGQGGDHITSSQVIDDGTTVRIPGALQVTGSTILANILTGTNATFTGSVNVSGSFIVTTTALELQVTNTGVTLGNVITDNHSVTGSLRVSGSIVSNGALTGTSATFSSNVSIGGNAAVQSGNVLSVFRTDNTRAIQLYTTSDECVINSWEASSEPLHIRSMGSGGRIQFFTSGSEKMRITSAGNVGIGTVTPNNLLELSSATSGGSLRFSSSANTAFYWDIGRDSVSTGDFLFRKASGGAASDMMRITNDGNVGIGVTPSAWGTSSIKASHC
jgi:hypothetical protein